MAKAWKWAFSGDPEHLMEPMRVKLGPHVIISSKSFENSSEAHYGVGLRDGACR